ncbi:MAG TPA: FecR family protein [Myxococcota bacterium]|nr:FecR family protein [Myxococcota bacterium]
MAKRRTQAWLLALAAFALVAADGPRDARLQLAVGQVEIAPAPGAGFAEAHSGDVLPAGSQVRTGPGARVEIRVDAGVVQLYERSLARIPSGPEGARKLEIARGAAGFDIHARGGQAPYEVRTPHSVVLVKGTRFTVTADPDGSTVSVTRGVVGLRRLGSADRELLVHAGFGAAGGAGRPFALGLLDQKGDPWEAWSTGAAPSRPLPAPSADRLAPASPDETEVVLQGAHDATLHVVASRAEHRVVLFGSNGFNAALSKADLDQVLRGNTALLGPQLLGMLRQRGVAPAAFAHQVLDNL